MRKTHRPFPILVVLALSASVSRGSPACAQETVTDPTSYTVLGLLQSAVTGAIQTMMNSVVMNVIDDDFS